MLSKADKTRQFIIEKAAPIFNTKGYSATSMNDILAATGLAKGGIYGNFSSKDEIAVEAFEYAYGKLKEALRFKIKQQQTATGKLIGILQFYRNYSINPVTKGGCPLQNTAIDSDDSMPFLKEKAAVALKEMLSSLEYIIQKGISSGEFNKKLNAFAEAVLFFATLEGGLMMSKLSDNPKILNSLLDNLKEQVENRFKR
jgi:TetR/AcrR family transcriptional regulator, transcriptional repressor for nem operon